MGIEKQTKLNQLLRNWPDGKIKSSAWFNAEGYGANLIQKYKTNNWIEAIGTGAFKKAGDEVTWASALECLQKQLKSEAHVGGKSAGFLTIEADKATIIVSSQERAYSEYIDELPKSSVVPKVESYEEL